MRNSKYEVTKEETEKEKRAKVDSHRYNQSEIFISIKFHQPIGYVRGEISTKLIELRAIESVYGLNLW